MAKCVCANTNSKDWHEINKVANTNLTTALREEYFLKPAGDIFHLVQLLLLLSFSVLGLLQLLSEFFLSVRLNA